jgi:hypothetical protein
MTVNRRDFISMATAASVAIKANPLWADMLTGSSSISAVSEEEGGFPLSDYTPFGYLDNPWHTWDINRSGILRSLPGIGFCLYYPAGPGGYFDFKRDEVYEAHLSLGFRIGRRYFREAEDFAAGLLTSPHHSKNILGYRFEAEGVRVESSFLQVDENALAVRTVLSEIAGQPQRIRVLASHAYKLGESEWWGRDGLAADFDRESDVLWMRSFAAGTVFAIASDRISSQQFLAARKEDCANWLDSMSVMTDKLSYYPQPMYGALRYDLDLKPRSRTTLVVVMARGKNIADTLKHARTSVPRVAEKFTEKRAEDAAFWNSAPQLTGDWPTTWKHGWTYDFETLRMMVRRPIGLYRHPWDAMQIQAPRNVLGETSIDMWALSYADPESAKAVFLGQFLDAIEPNIPCMREDGVMNMVAADGSECGTSISWCFPYFCAASIFDRTHDLEWLQRLYPGLTALLQWTLSNRTDAGGFLVGKCSWETGMETSKRFLIQQPTGGEPVEFLRLVELQAAASQAGEILSRFAKLLHDTENVSRWEQIRNTYTRKTQQLWEGDWFHDFDTRNGELVTTTPPDPSQAAPAFCGAATEDQRRRMLPKLRQMYEQACTQGKDASDDGSNALNWSSFVLPYLEAIWSTGDVELAGQVVTTIANRIYTSMDRRSPADLNSTDAYTRLGWPGVSCEIWGCRGSFGGEGYGWGAVMPAHIIRTLVGFRETNEPLQLLVCPNLPSPLAENGKRYGICGLNYGRKRVSLSFLFLDQQRLMVEMELPAKAEIKSVRADGGNTLEVKRQGTRWQFEAINHRPYMVQLS